MTFRTVLFVVGVAALIISVVTGRIELVLAGLVPLFLGAFWPSLKLPTKEDFRELDELDELEKLLDAAEESELSPDALLEVGVVEKLERTQTTINGIPQYRMILRVRGADMREFTGNLIMLIRPHEMAAVAPGALFTVAYEPENPTMLALVPEHRQEEARDQFHRQQVQLGLADPQAMEIHERGMPTTGVILTTTPTGEIRHGYTGLEVTVGFPDSHGNPVERSKRVFLPQSMLGQLTAGRQVDLWVLPEDDTRFILGMNGTTDS
ncbi:MAG TPA: hypothetical protein K8V93_11130 [Corynebacterium pollutisoli]|nr:hypothetical protein [Corynebacterium pollutisoli]